MRKLVVFLLLSLVAVACNKEGATQKKVNNNQFETVDLAIELLSNGESFHLSKSNSVEGVDIKNLVTSDLNGDLFAKRPGDVLYSGTSKIGAARAAEKALNDGLCVGVSLNDGVYTVKEIPCTFINTY